MCMSVNIVYMGVGTCVSLYSMTVKEQLGVSVLTFYLFKAGTMFTAAHTRMPDPHIPPFLFLILLYACWDYIWMLLHLTLHELWRSRFWYSHVHTYMVRTSAIEPFAQLWLPVPNWKATLVFIKFCVLKCLAYGSVNFESYITWHGWCIKSAAILNQLNCWWSRWTHWLCHCLFYS